MCKKIILINKLAKIKVTNGKHPKELTNDDLECDLKWNSPDEREFIWHGKKDKILSLYNTSIKWKLLNQKKFHSKAN